MGLCLDRIGPKAQRRLLLIASILVNLGILGFFKYYNFFVDSLAALLERLQLPFHSRTLEVILPVGISFYTFQSMSYALDVYRRQLKPTRNLINFLAYVSFFPQLVAGPIQRAGNLLPQFERTVVITRAMLGEGIWLMIWGLFKKVALADNFAPLADLAFGQTHFTAPVVIFGTIAFAFQIYCDFSGYSDIARGCARVLGFDIIWNFDLPYAATSVREFWRRWHISLSTWLRDYLYISLGGNRRGPLRNYVNLLLTMLLGGLWHGAAWNFVLWGLWHGAGLAGQRAWERWRRPQADGEPGRQGPHGSLPGAEPLPSLSNPAPDPSRYPLPSTNPRRWLGWVATLLFVGYGWLLFRARSLTQIVEMTRSLGTLSAPPWMLSFALNLTVFAIPLVLMEAWQVWKQDRLIPLQLGPRAKAALQGLLLLGIIWFWETKKIAFIYFQF